MNMSDRNGIRVDENVVDLTELFNKDYLSAGDFTGGSKTVTITEIGSREVYDRKTRALIDKPVIAFKEIEKMLVVNATNKNRLRDYFGTTAIRSLIGKRVILNKERCRGADGKPTEGVRIVGIPTDKPTAPAEPATQAQMERIHALIADGSINEPALCKYLKISGIGAISRTQAAEAIKAKTGEIIE
jgi:hypothetical protein